MNDLPLGKPTEYKSTYDPTLLVKVPRAEGRKRTGFTKCAAGADFWHAYELSFLLPSKKPEVWYADIIVPCDSPYIVESKSLKLYFNSFNNTSFLDVNEVERIIKSDLENLLQTTIGIYIDKEPAQYESDPDEGFLDDIELENVNFDKLDTSFLKHSSDVMRCETLTSNLLRSNCPITNQPDWATVEITYIGKEIDREGLLRYIISFRNHNEFHEECVERIYHDLKTHLDVKLQVVAKYTRRGGIDICPIRSDFKTPYSYARSWRQ